jgi:hypothetical protein
LDPSGHKGGHGSSGNKFRQDLSTIKGIGSVISYYYGLIDILFNDVLGGFAPATAAAPNGGALENVLLILPSQKFVIGIQQGHYSLFF